MAPALKITLFAALAVFVTSSSNAAPTKGTGTWTLYYVFEADGTESTSGSTITIVTEKGEKLRVRVSPPVLRKANLEGTVTSVDPKDGKRYVTNFIKLGHWEDLPEGWEGKGNRSNPLAAYRSVAADQNHHPFGSRVYLPSLVGFTPPGFTQPHDGYLWVADIGGGIKGSMRFDGFVGKEATYEFVMKLENQQGKWRIDTEVENLPSAPSGYSPKTESGRKKILTGLGLLNDTDKTNLTTALITFQKQHHHIPPSEYGTTVGAVTLWYLTQAALKVSKGESYDPVAAGKHP